MDRHYGMDWLRIGAFAVLILYHVGMVFVPWGFHVKAAPTIEWLTLPMLAVNAWRLSLLFVVSGFATRALLAKSGGPGRLARGRSARLLIPLAFGIAVIVPPQPWVELVVKHGYPDGFLHFWGHDYFRFGQLAGLDLPTWNHLWFVAYLWIYTMLLAVAAAVLPRQAGWQRGFDRAFGGWGVLAWPLAWLVAVHGWWFVMARETHALVGDWVAHASYLPAFGFGFGLAGSPVVMAALRRHARTALALALAGYAGVLAVELTWPGKTPAPRWVYAPYGVAHALQQWGGIAALVALADRRWNHDHRWRRLLTEAVFPFYLIHQTIIIAAMYWLLRTALPAASGFAILVATTAAGCALFYWGGRQLGPLRPLIGLRGPS